MHTIVFGLLCVAASCTQLVPTYDEAIDQGSQSLRAEFLKFVADRQQQIAQGSGPYKASDYSTLQSDLGAIELRAADQPNGVDCNKVIDAFTHAHTGISSFSTADIGAAAAAYPGGSCIVVLAGLAAKQLERLRADDARRCATTPASQSCIDLFGTKTVAQMVADLHTPEDHVLDLRDVATASPLVRATLVSIDEMAGAEQDLKAVSNKQQ